MKKADALDSILQLFTEYMTDLDSYLELLPFALIVIALIRLCRLQMAVAEPVVDSLDGGNLTTLKGDNIGGQVLGIAQATIFK